MPRSHEMMHGISSLLFECRHLKIITGINKTIRDEFSGLAIQPEIRVMLNGEIIKDYCCPIKLTV